jgi:hypothetical protein
VVLTAPTFGKPPVDPRALEHREEHVAAEGVVVVANNKFARANTRAASPRYIGRAFARPRCRSSS